MLAGHQETDGLHGALIVREPRADDPVSSRYDVDLPQHTMLVWHWFEMAADSQSVDQRLVSLVRDGYGLLVNGKGGIVKFLDKYGLSMFTPSETFNVLTVRTNTQS